MVNVTPYIPPVYIEENEVFFEFENSAIMKFYRNPRMLESPSPAHLYSGMKINHEMLVKIDGFVLLVKHDGRLFKQEFGDASPLHSLPRRKITVEAITGQQMEICDFRSGGSFDDALRKNLKSKNPELMNLICLHDLEGSDNFYTERNVDKWCGRYNQEIQRQIYTFVRTHMLTYIGTLQSRGWIKGKVESPELQVEGYIEGAGPY